MNILWISHNVPYPPITGVLQRNYNLLKEASKVGNIYLVAFFQKSILPIEYDMREVRRELGKLCLHIDILPMPVESSKMLSFYKLVFKSFLTAAPFGVNCMKSREMHQKIQQIVSNIKFDIVHFDTISLAEYREDVGKCAKILNHHNIESKLMERRSLIEKNILKKMYYKMEARKLKEYEMDKCQDFDINFSVSTVDKQSLLEICPESKIEVIPNGVDIEYFNQENVPVIKGSLIIVGGMNWYPNRDAVTYMCKEVWPLLKKKCPNVSLTVVGAQPPEELLGLARKDDKVLVTGFVDDMRPYMRNAEVYICTMRDGGGTRLKILDALAMGKAIVSTTIGCEGIDVTPEKNVLIADTPSLFVDQIKRVIENVELRDMLGSEGRRLVEEKYSWKVIGRTLSSIYRELYR